MQDRDLRCFACGGPYHSATGHLFNASVAYCGPCTRHFFTWWRGHSKRRWGKLNFYEEAAKTHPKIENGAP